MFFSMPTPPLASAGKNFSASQPMFMACCISPAVAVPGMARQPLSMTYWVTLGSKPGATMKEAPASMARSTWSLVRTVPAPSSISGISLWIRRMHSSAQAVRKVTSAAGRPPSDRALHRGRASSTLLKAMTGIMPIS